MTTPQPALRPYLEIIEKQCQLLDRDKLIPVDIVRSVVRAATKRIVYEYWEWKKILGIACAVFRFSEKKRGYEIALERGRASRDYLFGRLLAVADCLEGFALSQAEKGGQLMLPD